MRTDPKRYDGCAQLVLTCRTLHSVRDCDSRDSSRVVAKRDVSAHNWHQTDLRVLWRTFVTMHPNQPFVVAHAAETKRLLAVRGLDLLDTSPEGEFDEIVELAANICGVKMGLMTIVDAERVFHKSHVGMDIVEAPRVFSVCDHTIRQDGPFIIEDATQDSRFADNPYVHGPRGIRFYAGSPLEAPTGERVGSLCVVDTVPRSLTPNQSRALEILARQISVRLKLRWEHRELQRAAVALRASETMFRAFLNDLPFEAHIKNARGELIFYNRTVAIRFQINEREWIGKTSRDLWPLAIANRIIREDAAVLASGQPLESLIDIPDLQGKLIHWRVVKVPCHMVDGGRFLATVAFDITEDVLKRKELEWLGSELEEANVRLQTLSLTDELTGLANRRAFEQRLKESTALARRTKEPLSLLMLDVDDFKSLNDVFGHRAGDEVLQELGSVIEQGKRTHDVASRYGGEEFAIILARTASDGSKIIAERLLETIRFHAWRNRRITVSIGCAQFAPGMTEDDLVKNADTALYEAKRHGKDRFVIFPATEA